MAAGLGLLRLPPAQFWVMTPRELTMALRGLARVPAIDPLEPLSRHDLSELMTRFPDAQGNSP